MFRARRAIVLFALLISVAAGSAACSNSNPAGPSSSGATISGSLIADRAMSGVTVSVSGTNLGAVVGSSQQFTIREVPAGAVRLLFRGPALNGTVDLSGVRDADTIEVRVRVNGSSVSLESENRRHDDDDDDGDEVEFEGALTSRTGTAPALTLLVAGRTVQTSASTVVRRSGNTLTLDALAIGQTLEVEGRRQADGSVLAEKLQIEDDDDDENEVEFSGTLTSRTGLVPNLTLIVGGRTVRTNAGTEIRTRHGGNALDFAALVVGQTLEVKGNRQPDASIVARRIRVGN